MKKTISFFVRHAAQPARIEDHEVDLSLLTPTAVELALRISTTDMRDDLSHVGLRCKYPRRELCEQIIADYEAGGRRYSLFEYHNSLKILDGIANGDPWGVADQILTTEYIWDSLHEGETPEAYLNRHASYIGHEAQPYLKDSELIPISFKEILLGYGLGQSDFSRLSGIPLRTVQGWCNETRNPTDWQISLIRFFLDHQP